MKTAPKKTDLGIAKPFCGPITRKEAALKVVAGTEHVHCTTLGEKDPCFQITCKQAEGEILDYPWRLTRPMVLSLTTSNDRKPLIDQITGATKGGTRRSFSKRIASVLEELITNAIYHSYRNADGSEKYARSLVATLTPNETVLVSFQENPNGIFLSVRDNGGSLSFAAVGETLQRCYGNEVQQLDSKAGGAGLGLYMVFETVSHLLIEVDGNKCTQVSCWIANKGSFDPQTFSFNFFSRRPL